MGKGLAGAALWAFACALGACGGEPPPARPPPGPPRAESPAPSIACGDEVDALAAKARAADAEHDERCAVRAATKALGLCAGLADPEVRRLAAGAEAARDDHGEVQLLGPWVLERVAQAGETRVWDLGPDGPRLRFRIDGDEIALSAGDRLRVALGDDLAVLDPRAGTQSRATGVHFVAESAGHLFVAGPAEVRRLRLADLGPAGAVPWSEVPSAGEGRALRGGATLLYGGAVISFDTGAVLRTDRDLPAARPDEARILAYDGAAASMVEIDTATGAELARFALAKGAKIETGNLAPAYAPDPRYAFWFELGPERRDHGTAIVVAVGDTRTGRVQRFEDPRETWSIAFSGWAHLDAGGERLCADFASFHSGWTTCAWRLGPGGRARHDTRPAPASRPRLADVGLAGALELARAWTPDHRRSLLLTYRRAKDETKHDLRLTVVGAGGKVERVARLQAGEFLLDDRALDEPGNGDMYPNLPRVAPLDDAHAVVVHGVGSVEDKLVDLRTGDVSEPCSGHTDCRVVGRFTADPTGAMRDLLTGEVFVLSAGAAAFAAVPRAEAACP
jgi:hypothetical protein